jgi:transcription antitermination factor NusG
MTLWGVAVARPLSERKAAGHLAASGWEHYLPRTRNALQHEVLLFPRYIFVALTEQWRRLIGLPGLSKLLFSCEHPAVVNEHFIDELRAMEDKSGHVRLPHLTHEFRQGQTVRIKRGVMAGQLGLYQGMTAPQRELVLLDALGVVDLPLGCLEAA